MKHSCKNPKFTLLILAVFFFMISCTKDNDLFAEAIQEDIEEQIDEENRQNPDTDTPDDAVVDNNNSGELKAFPSAYGAGAYVTGGRGGRIIPVTRLDDARDSSGSPMEGTLRYALTRQEKRIVTFRVSGTIVIGDTDGDGFADSSHTIGVESYAGRNHNDLTVAGQTAPEGGITIKGHIYMDRTSNMIWRYVRLRKEDEFTGLDVITANNTKDVIFDHLSVSYGSDEGSSIANNTNGQFPSTGITLQNCFFAHNKTGNILGATSAQDLGGQMSYLNNFVTNTTHRFPNTAANGDYEIINNLVYNWGFRLVNVINAPKLNHINNAYIAGPRTTRYYESGNFSEISHKINLADNSTLNAEIYTAGNFISDYLTDPNADNWSTWTVFVTANGYQAKAPVPNSLQVSTPHQLLGSPIEIRTAEEIRNNLPNEVGAYKTLDSNGRVVVYRDELDSKWISEYFSNSGPDYSYGSEPFVYAFVPSNEPYADSDLDGMPDNWEIANGFNPDVQDHNDDADGDGYTNIEEFLNLVDL